MTYKELEVVKRVLRTADLGKIDVKEAVYCKTNDQCFFSTKGA